MSAMLVSAKDFSITKYVMSDDIDDIQDPDITWDVGHFFNGNNQERVYPVVK